MAASLRKFLGPLVSISCFTLAGYGCAPASPSASGTSDDGQSTSESPTGTSSAPSTTSIATSTAGPAESSGFGGAGSTTSGPEPGTEESADSSGPGPIKLDLGIIPDMPAPVCGEQGSGELSLSYIWIANSSQGTISKINTSTMVEEGRYQARPFSGDPSRTSVNLVGDVAVANRNGGVAKFWANADDCINSNGQPGIQTSTGGTDILTWGTDDCLAWYTELSCGSNRPMAWTRGEFNESQCTYENMKLWTVCDSQALLLNGDTGVIEETIQVGGGFSTFMYGGAADADGNFWGLDTGSGSMIRIDFETLATQSWSLPATGGYGITVDSLGRPWVCGGGTVSRFDLTTSTWTSSAGGGNGIGGCMTDGADLIWHGTYPSGQLRGFNIETLAVEEEIMLPEYVHGVSVDFEGKVWGVSFAGSTAYRADPVTDTVDTFNGLVGAYTYSDMTGFSLSTVGGGGMPPT